MKNGSIVIFYGEGHGKSTAAIGTAVQAACQSKTVIDIQFLKSKEESNQEFLGRLEPEIKFFSFSKSDTRFENLSEEAKQEEAINLRNGFNYSKKVLSTGACDLLVLDEFLGLCDVGLIQVEEILDLLKAKPEEMTVILTGRVMRPELAQIADEIYCIGTEKTS